MAEQREKANRGVDPLVQKMKASDGFLTSLMDMGTPAVAPDEILHTACIGRYIARTNYESRYEAARQRDNASEELGLINVRSITRWRLRRFGRTEVSERRRTPGQEVRNRKADAQVDLLAGKGMASDTGLIDFERDSKAPRSSRGRS